MTTVSFSNPQNVVAFCEKRLDKEAVSQIIKKHNEGVNSPEIEEKLESNDYISTLSLIWGERDAARRLSWLRNHADRLHAPLLYEQAIAEFKESPTVETVIQVSLPLIKAASSRVAQDAQCSQDASVYSGDAHIRMEYVYNRALMDVQKKYAPSLNLNNILSENKNIIKKTTLNKLKEVAEQSIKNPNMLPSPAWIGFHGMSCFIQGHPNMLPSQQFEEKRSDVAKKFLEQQGERKD